MRMNIKLTCNTKLLLIQKLVKIQRMSLWSRRHLEDKTEPYMWWKNMASPRKKHLVSSEKNSQWFYSRIAVAQGCVKSSQVKEQLEVAVCRCLQLGDVQDAQGCYWQSFLCCCHMEVRVWWKPQSLSLFIGTWSTLWHYSHHLKAGTLQSQASVDIMNDYLEETPPPYWMEEKHIDMKRRSNKRRSRRGNWDAYIVVEERWYIDALTLTELEVKSKSQFNQNIFPIKYSPRPLTMYILAEGGCLYFITSFKSTKCLDTQKQGSINCLSMTV